MALADRVPATKKKKGPACSVDTMLLGMDSADRETALGWLDEEVYSTQAIFELLTEEGFVCSHAQLKRHRRKVCVCYATS
jgi:hypothetical protein